jgi:Mg2+-importing ATPase
MIHGLSSTVLDQRRGEALFHTGWFVEGPLSQVLPQVLSKSSSCSYRAVGASPHQPGRVALAAAFAVAIGLLRPPTPLAGPLHLTVLPTACFPWLVAILTTYLLAAHTTKIHYASGRSRWL